MKLVSYNKDIVESNNIRDMYEYALKNGNHYYPTEYVDTVLNKVDELNINDIYKDMLYIYDDITLENVDAKKCACCGKEEGLRKAILNKTYEISICEDCSTLHNSPKSVYVLDFLSNLNSLYELIQFTTNNQILLSTSRHIKANGIIYKIKTKLGYISYDLEGNIFYIHE